MVSSPDAKQVKKPKQVEDLLNSEITLIDLSKDESKQTTKGESLLAFIKSLLNPEASDQIIRLLS